MIDILESSSPFVTIDDADWGCDPAREKSAGVEGNAAGSAMAATASAATPAPKFRLAAGVLVEYQSLSRWRRDPVARSKMFSETELSPVGDAERSRESSSSLFMSCLCPLRGESFTIGRRVPQPVAFALD